METKAQKNVRRVAKHRLRHDVIQYSFDLYLTDEKQRAISEFLEQKKANRQLKSFIIELIEQHCKAMND